MTIMVPLSRKYERPSFGTFAVSERTLKILRTGVATHLLRVRLYQGSIHDPVDEDVDGVGGFARFEQQPEVRRAPRVIPSTSHWKNDDSIGEN